MSALASFVPFCLPMAQKPKAEKTIQLGDRIKESVKKRADDFCVRHPLQPSRAALIEASLMAYLDAHEPELPPKPRKP